MQPAWRFSLFPSVAADLDIDGLGSAELRVFPLIAMFLSNCGSDGNAGSGGIMTLNDSSTDSESSLEASTNGSGDDDISTARCQGVISFDDANLEAAVRASMGGGQQTPFAGELTMAEVEGLTHVSGEFWEISELGGIESLSALTMLRLGYNDYPQSC